MSWVIDAEQHKAHAGHALGEKGLKPAQSGRSYKDLESLTPAHSTTNSLLKEEVCSAYL
jgi:hypothetical protein